MTATVFAPIKPQAVSATEQVFATLYGAIIRLDLPPGAKVSEGEVAKQLEVSRQPVRDAFYRLSNLGLLAIRPQRATLITKISERAVVDAVFTRIALEVACLRLMAGKADPLQAELTKQEVALANGDQAEFHRLDDAFHETLCVLAGHAHAWVLIRDQKAHMDRIRYLTLSEERRDKVMKEHRELVSALRAGQMAAAEDALRAHLGGVLDLVPQVRAQYPDYFEKDETA